MSTKLLVTLEALVQLDKTQCGTVVLIITVVFFAVRVNYQYII